MVLWTHPRIQDEQIYLFFKIIVYMYSGSKHPMFFLISLWYFVDPPTNKATVSRWEESSGLQEEEEGEWIMGKTVASRTLPSTFGTDRQDSWHQGIPGHIPGRVQRLLHWQVSNL